MYFTIGANIGKADCPIPTCGLEWKPVRPPVVLREWPAVTGASRRFTTPFVVRVAAPGRGRRAATLTACTTNLTNDPDPVPGNNCRSVAIRLARSR